MRKIRSEIKIVNVLKVYKKVITGSVCGKIWSGKLVNCELFANISQ